VLAQPAPVTISGSSAAEANRCTSAVLIVAVLSLRSLSTLGRWWHVVDAAGVSGFLLQQLRRRSLREPLVIIAARLPV
jgi:hypothetical protein